MKIMTTGRECNVPLHSERATRFLFHPEWTRIAISTKLSNVIHTVGDHIHIDQVSHDIVVQHEPLLEGDGLAML